jgi:hypothetical protein
MGTKLFTLAVMTALMPSAAFSAPTSQSCLEIDDARNVPITVEIDGHPGYWVLQPNQTYTIVSTPAGAPENSGPPVRGASFNLRVYDGDERAGTKSGLYDTVSAVFTVGSYGTATHTLLTYLDTAAANYPGSRTAPECRQTGVWVVLIHD